MRMSALVLLTLLPVLGAAGTAAGQTTAPPALDPAWKVPEVIAFMGIKPGDRVADVVGGRLTVSIARAVGPQGKVYAIETAEVVKEHPEVLEQMHAAAQTFPNIMVSADPAAAPLPDALDIVFIRQNYHDLYDKFMGPVDVPAFNRAVYAALKRGGVYVVLDHATVPGAGVSATETLHRIDPVRVKADVLAAGFRLDGESTILANPADDHSRNVFAPQIRGHTDQFLLRFRKPG